MAAPWGTGHTLLMRPLLLPFALLCGCATVQSPGTFTPPGRPAPLVQGRTVALNTARCDAPNLIEGDIPETVAWLDQNIDAQVSSKRVPIDDGSARSVCEELGTDRALFRDAVFGTDWTVSQTVTTLVKQVANTAQADHVWVPLVRTRPACAVGEVQGDSYSAGVSPTAFESEIEGSCTAKESDFGLFLFNADGTLVWKSSAVAGKSELATREAATQLLMANLPARAPSEGVLVKETPP